MLGPITFAKPAKFKLAIATSHMITALVLFDVDLDTSAFITHTHTRLYSICTPKDVP